MGWPTVLVWFGYSHCLVFLQLWFGLYSALIGLGNITAVLLPMPWFVWLHSWFGWASVLVWVWLTTVLIWSGYSLGLVFFYRPGLVWLQFWFDSVTAIVGFHFSHSAGLVWLYFLFGWAIQYPYSKVLLVCMSTVYPVNLYIHQTRLI